MIDSPKVTVLMPVYNGEKYLREAIESILVQTFADFEFLIINDSSTDRSVEIIQSYNDPRIRLIQNESNLGLATTRNKGLSEANGEYIALLDCDDVAFPQRLSEQVSFMDQHPDFGMVGSWIEMIDENSRATGEVMRYTASPDEIPVFLLFNNYFAQSTLLIRKTVLPVGGYDSRYTVAEDYDLWVRISNKSKVWNLQKTLIYYRVHGANVSTYKSFLLEQCVRDIIINQLHSLQIVATQNELEVHRNIGNDNYGWDIEFIKSAEKWLNKLYEANSQIKCYNKTLFNNYIGKKWQSICFSNTRLGLPVVLAFWHSSLSGLVKLRMSEKIKFYINSLFKLQTATK